MLRKLTKELTSLKNEEKIPIYQNFFKTGKGQYGEGDIFYGLTVPQQRTLAKKYKDLPLKDVKRLLNHKVHEFRLTATLILVHKYENSNNKEEIFNFYLNNTSGINNWDLVDISADKILGAHLINKDKSILYKFVKSKDLWKRRMSIISTFHFIKNNQFQDTLKISKLLLKDKHDLIHKAVGWMLREVGKRDIKAEENFLNKHYKEMPRTMLRYSIERFEESKRKHYVKK